ncbi:MAG TPA: hypothetical protein PKH09_14415, partial [Parvularculaceae bacterium]|nr:hypothetical protein [Parvularculaceae bacterium]
FVTGPRAAFRAAGSAATMSAGVTGRRGRRGGGTNVFFVTTFFGPPPDPNDMFTEIGPMPDGPPPGIFVSFASLKDPAHDPCPDQKHVGEVLALTDWSTVERWAMEPPGSRGADYRDFKERVERRMFEQFENYFPEVAKLVVHRELATPLSITGITGHEKGSFYGREVTPKRLFSEALRMKTPIKGLYLSGQDVCSPGVAGALWGGVLAAANVDPKVFTHLRT